MRNTGGKKCSFFRKCGMLCFLEALVLRFALLPYYRRVDMKLFRPKICSCSIRSGVIKFLWDETDPEDIPVVICSCN